MALANKFEQTSAATREFTLESLKQITDNFSKKHVIGRGGYGVVYKGVLENGEKIALKKLNYVPGLDDTQFRNEFSNLMRAEHPNITRLVGYCYHQGHQVIEHQGGHIFALVVERVLCFEYLQGGSLDKQISDESCGLDWDTRFKIINGVCLGLHYLHNGSKDCIYHLDLKPANILLDKDMVPKIGDFGLSRLFPSAQTIFTNKNIGTPLGVIIIRIMAGDEGYSKSLDMSPQEFLEHVHENWRKRLQATMLSHTSDQIEICIKIALRCVEVDRMKRPTIAEIVDELNKHIHIADGDAKRGKMTSAEETSEDVCTPKLTPVPLTPLHVNSQPAHTEEPYMQPQHIHTAEEDAKREKVTVVEKTSEDVCTPKLASVPLTPLHVNSRPAHTEEPYMQPQVSDLQNKPLRRPWLSSWWRDQIITKLSDLARLPVKSLVIVGAIGVALVVAQTVISSVPYLARLVLTSADFFLLGLGAYVILKVLLDATDMIEEVLNEPDGIDDNARTLLMGCFLLGSVLRFPNIRFVIGLLAGLCYGEHHSGLLAFFFLLGLVVGFILTTLPTAYFILGLLVSSILTYWVVSKMD
ncbi:cysteine-rich receptor-like protein kinase 8 isoform X2 [Triticum urartu]|uniref:cysteine-rich receptor-like protein kinase 8 isoform X2 n=1 Tax=Triticum urartu TaxID=4572 RepID=UPI0020433B9F|nr:cysteine-rich receptor-like protein kinase 8 isoform X2 [Triticum urartu]